MWHNYFVWLVCSVDTVLLQGRYFATFSVIVKVLFGLPLGWEDKHDGSLYMDGMVLIIRIFFEFSCC